MTIVTVAQLRNKEVSDIVTTVEIATGRRIPMEMQLLLHKLQREKKITDEVLEYLIQIMRR